MDRETSLLIALGMLIAAALVVGVSGWILLARDRSLRHAQSTVSDGGVPSGAAHDHPEAVEER
jgi:hypothetical protein